MKIFLIILYYSFYLLFPFVLFIIWKLYKSKKKSLELILILLISLVLIWARFIEPNYIVAKNYNFFVSDNKGRELKVVVFSDPHLGVFNNGRLLKKTVEKINKEDVDLVLIPGDFIYKANRDKLIYYFESLKNLKAPTVAVLGNHDYGKINNDFSLDLTKVLGDLGVLMVDNKLEYLSINDSIVEIIGVADLWVGSPDYTILEDLNTKKDLSIILTHNPDSVYDIEASSDILIAGHTHAGQIRIPFLYKKIIPSKYNFNKGFYNVNNIDVFVTPGIGNVVLPLRLFNFPELSILKIVY